jgi:thiamine-monophosphate kinase
MRQQTMREVGEHGFLAALLPRLLNGRGVVVGPGHDCAVVRCGGSPWLVTIDSLVEGAHFRNHWLSPYQLGRKSFLINASDIAAMGGRPRFCVVNLGAPAGYRVGDLTRLQAGIVDAAAQFGALVVGGNLSSSRQLTVTLTLLGEAPTRLCTRRGARPGDRIYVTGRVGDAALAVRLWRRGQTPPQALIRRFGEPQPRLAAGRLLVDRGLATAMIDVSDGIVQDLGHLCAASGVGARLEARAVPVSAAYRAALGADRRLALTGGEDYELLCTVATHNIKRLERAKARLGCPLRCIGEIVRGHGVRVVDAGGAELRLGKGGFDHFDGGR